MTRSEQAKRINERRRNRTNMERFVAKMGKEQENGCIPFLGSSPVRQDEYGSFSWRKRLGEACADNIGAHVASYRLFKGSVPKGKLVMHECDNRACVNPKHLTLGTQKQNMEHCVASRRIATGARQGLSRMTDESVIDLRERHAAGETGTSLALRFGISQATVSQITRRVTWRHLA